MAESGLMEDLSVELFAEALYWRMASERLAWKDKAMDPLAALFAIQDRVGFPYITEAEVRRVLQAYTEREKTALDLGRATKRLS